MQAQLRPISPRPPRKMTRTGAACALSHGRPAELFDAVPQRPASSSAVGRPHRQSALADREAQRAQDRLGSAAGSGQSVRSLEAVGVEQLGVAGRWRRSTSPATKASSMAAISRPIQCEATEITPTAPTAMRGRVSTSSPL